MTSTNDLIPVSWMDMTSHEAQSHAARLRDMSTSLTGSIAGEDDDVTRQLLQIDQAALAAGALALEILAKPIPTIVAEFRSRS